MRVRVLGGSGGLVPNRNLICFRVNDDTVIDAGSVAQTLPIDEQAAIDHVILTHAHLDHSGNLPFFVDNIFGMRKTPFVVHSIPETLKSVKEHLFNNDVWPDFSRLPTFESASMRFSEIKDEEPTKIGSLTVTAVRVNHTVPSVGYIVEEEDVAVLFSGDTAETDRLWELANQRVNLKAAFVETSFPNSMQNIADVSGHLTPQTLATELPKLSSEIPVYVYHIKPRFHAEVVAEIAQISRPNIHIAEEGRAYDF